MSDLVIRHGQVLSAGKVRTADIAIRDGLIVEVAPSLDGKFGTEIDATGHLVLPGVVDAHVHFNEPGREHWEGFASGSLALAAGGGTSFIDMPLNASPPTIDRASFEAKRAAGEKSSRLDFALWGGLIPENLDRLEELAECGVVGFKAFMIDSGIEDFPGVAPDVLRKGMEIAARLGLPVAVHAEDPAIIEKWTREIRKAGGRGVRDYLDSRPTASEIEAVRLALDFAGETGCPLHVVHLSCPEAIDLVAAAKAAGLDVTCEVCPHHLLLDETAMFTHGAFAKCAPPLRDETCRASVWDRLLEGVVDCVGSDHSPAPPDMKQGDDIFKMWGGIMGCQHGFLLLLDAVLARAPEQLPELWARVSAMPAARFGLGDRKGRIESGCDADLVFIERGEPRMITADELKYRHRTSPYVGREIFSHVARSLLRGRDVGLSDMKGCFLPRKL